MNNKQRYSSNDVFAKGKCISDFFSNNTGSSGNSMTHRWILMLTTGRMAYYGKIQNKSRNIGIGMMIAFDRIG